LTIVKEKDYPQLNSILFGEGIVNDAVSILIFETIQNVFGGKEKQGSGHQKSEGSGIAIGDIGMSVLHFVYLSIASIAIGICFGLFSALISKKLVNFKEHQTREIIMIFVLAYLSYLI
jgi:NhaP-type Na+/H+ or K+/H+ antiporter